MGLRAALPDAAFTLEHVIGRQDPRMAPRCSLHGRHAIYGRFGQPTGAEVYVMGLSHAE
jgi:hypothetical protein